MKKSENWRVSFAFFPYYYYYYYMLVCYSYIITQAK